MSEQDLGILNRWVKSRAVGEKQTLRARIVLMTTDRTPSQTIMDTLKIGAPTLNLWPRRFADCGIDGLKKGTMRPSRIPPLPVEKVQEVLTLTISGKPAAHATHWSCRTMAEQAGISRMAVHRIWREHQLKPHRVKGFKVSNDPQFEEKLRDVVGLYLDPPEKAIVLSVDEKSQIQALDRTQPGLPMKPGKNGTVIGPLRQNSCRLRFSSL